MKITLFILASLFLICPVKSQVVFCPPGAEWNYLFSMDFSYAKYNETIKYKGDTIIGLETMKILTHQKFFTQINMANYGPTYIKQKGDTIFMKNGKTFNKWQILYNFDASTGHFWENSLQIGNDTINYKVTVTAVNTVTVNGFALKQLLVNYRSTYSSGNVYKYATITERLGCSEFLFNYESMEVSDGDYFASNLCYKDNAFGTKQYTSYSCNFSNPVSVTTHDNSGNFFSIYPNPTNSDLIVTLEGKSLAGYRFKLLNVIGQECTSTVIEGETTVKLNMTGFEAGIYFLQIIDDSGNESAQKIVKY